MRYKGTKIFSNNEDYYEYLRRERNLKSVDHYATPILRNPTVGQRASLVTNQHIWKYGDRLSNLAFKYYGDVRYWWVIAWYNAVPTEASLENGDLIAIPVNLGKTLAVLGV
jgi:nucleoid-associated protein YgaU|tara:strand:- start:9 stop:341 length:333 start_codon:yes stop_codon:yes gene_type:complete